MKVYTKTGDKGQTSLFGGERVGKNDQRVNTYGTVDEANSMMGLARSLCQDQEVKDTVLHLQKKMFVLGAHLATPSHKLDKLKERITLNNVSSLEKMIDYFDTKRPPLNQFVPPGASPASAALDLARTIVRRGERLAVALAEEEDISQDILIYFNRLSDLLFVLARAEENTALVKSIAEKVKEKMTEIKEREKFSLELAKSVIDKAEKKSRAIGVPMVIAIVDDGGNLVVLQRSDGALLASLDIAINKAYTAAALKMPTHILGELSQPGQPLYGVQNTNQGKIVTFGGGFPLKVGERVIAAIGVSGGSVEEDILVAQAGVEFFEKGAE